VLPVLFAEVSCWRMNKLLSAQLSVLNYSSRLL